MLGTTLPMVASIFCKSKPTPATTLTVSDTSPTSSRTSKL
jgi:hypothetical protein